MESTLKALADLLLEAVPTIIFFIFLVWYLGRVFFKPIAAILEERRKATEGVKDLAKQAAEAADKKQSEFERALGLARGELWEEQEKLRREWSQEQSEAIAKAREEVSQQIDAAKAGIATEADNAQKELETQIGGLSEGIVSTLLKRRAA